MTPAESQTYQASMTTCVSKKNDFGDWKEFGQGWVFLECDGICPGRLYRRIQKTITAQLEKLHDDNAVSCAPILWVLKSSLWPQIHGQQLQYEFVKIVTSIFMMI